MTRFLELLTSVVIVVILFVLVGVFLPNKRAVHHSAETSHPIRQVYDTLNSFKRFGDWNPLRQHDPNVRYSLSGPERGEGAKLDFASHRVEVGNGSWQIVESKQDELVRFAVHNEFRGINKTHVATLGQRGKIVEIDWHYSVEYEWDLLGRYAGLYVERTVGDDVKRGLANFTNLLASMPNFDYSTLSAPEITQIAPANILYISTTADRNITAVENAMLLALKDLRTAISANQLVETGRPRLVTTNFGSDKYEFDVAIPVARRDEVPPTAPAEGEEGEEAADPAALASKTGNVDLTPPAALEDLRLPDNIRSGQSYGGRVVMSPFKGHPAALPLIRDQLRSYAAAFGEELQDRAFEEYLTEISDTVAEEAQFQVYWPIK